MDEEWRCTAKSITKYNPIYRDEEGRYTKNEWIGFFQVGKTVNGQLLSIEEYLQVEEKYIQSAIAFFEFHSCKRVVVKHLEKDGPLHSDLSENGEMLRVYNQLTDDMVFAVEDLDIIIKLILREIIWAELFCIENDTIAIRFGYDFYMYVNSDKNLDAFFDTVRKLGLYVA